MGVTAELINSAELHLHPELALLYGQVHLRLSSKLIGKGYDMRATKTGSKGLTPRPFQSNLQTDHQHVFPVVQFESPLFFNPNLCLAKH